MPKITLDNVASGYDLSKVNANFQAIEDELNNRVMYRNNEDGSSEALSQDVDANSKRIYNLPEPLSNSEAARLADVQNALAGGAANLISNTPAGNIVATNVQSAINELDTEKASLASLISSIGSSLIGFIQSGIGAVTRTVQDKLRERVCIFDYMTSEEIIDAMSGAPVLDHSAAIMKAHDALPATGGEILVIGSLRHSSQLVFTKRVRFIGKGVSHSNAVSPSEFVKASSLAETGVVLGANGITVEGVAFRGEVGNTGDGVLIRASRIAMRDCAVYGMGQDGVRIGTDSGGENCNLWLLDNVKTKSNGRDGVRISEGAGPLADSNAGTCLHIDTQSNGGAGVYLGGTQLSTFVGGAYQNNGTYGIHVSANAEYNCFYGGDVEANTAGQVRIETGAEFNAFYIYTLLFSMFSIASSAENNRIECIDHNRIVHGIKFPPTQITSNDPNTLDDYEEGSFTPVIEGSTSAGVGTYTAQVGRYTKIGNIVNFAIVLSWTAHTGTGNMDIAGLPFTSQNTSNLEHPVSNISSGVTLTASNILQTYIPSNSTKINIRQIPVGGGSLATVSIDTAGTLEVSGTYRV